MTVTVTSFVATVPAGTTHTVALNVGTNDVIRIRWRVPPGPRGNLSWYLAMGGVQVLPGTMGTAIVADDESDVWEIGDLPDSGAWQLIGTNTGSFDHSVYLQFFTEPVGQGGTTGGNILDGFPVSDADLPGLFLT